MSQPDFDTIGAGIIDELHRRLGDPALARDLPGTLLMKFAETYLKAIEKRNELEQAKQEQEKVDPLTMIDQPGMGVEARLSILTEYMAYLQDTYNDAYDRLEKILEEHENNTDVVQDVQDVVPEEGGMPDVRVSPGEEPSAGDGDAELAPVQVGGDGGPEPSERSGDSEEGEKGA